MNWTPFNPDYEPLSPYLRKTFREYGEKHDFGRHPDREVCKAVRDLEWLIEELRFRESNLAMSLQDPSQFPPQSPKYGQALFEAAENFVQMVKAAYPEMQQTRPL